MRGIKWKELLFFGMHDLIPLPKDYNAELNFQFLSRSPKELLHQIEGNSVFKLLRAGRRKILIQVVPEKEAFHIMYPDKLPTEKEKAFIRDYVSEWFDLQNDLSEFYALGSKDPLLRPLIKKYYGYRIVGQPDLFESLTWAVIGQQINLSFAYTLKHRFVENYGESGKWNGRKFYLFPTPQVVAEIKDEELLAIQFSRQKSKYIRLLAETFATGAVSKESISAMPFHEAKQKLMALKGIGNWTANYALMKTFHYRQAFPLEDAGIHNAIKNLKKLQDKPTLDEVRKIFKKYQGWEAYATLYLWKSL